MENCLLENLISEDYKLRGAGRWLRSVEHDSLVVDTEKQLFFWNSEEIAGDAFIWLTKIKKLTYREAKDRLRDCKEFDGYLGSVVVNKHDEEVVVYEKLVNIFWENGKNNREYWYKRTLTDATIDRFKLGYYEGWYTIPIFEDGRLKNIQKRRDLPEKTILPYYKGIGTFMFNTDILGVVDKVFLTESPTDCMVLNQNGIPAVSQNGGAGNFDKNWFKYFINQKEVFIVYDNDSAGRLGAIKVAKILGEHKCKLYNYDDYKEHYDTGDFFKEGNSRADFLNLVNSYAKYCFEYPEYFERKRK